MVILQFLPQGFGLRGQLAATVIYRLFLLICTYTFLFSSPLFAQEVSLKPLADMPLYGNYCVTSSGISLKTLPHSGSFELFVPGTPVRSYWVWTGRSLSPPNQGDSSIKIGHNDLSTVDIFAEAQGESPYSIRTWHSYLYTDTDLSLIQPLTNTFTVSDFSVNSLHSENHGVGLLVVYEAADCPFQQIDIRWGLDSFHYSRTPPHGPDTENVCTSFGNGVRAGFGIRPLDLTIMLGGVAGLDRGNVLWTLTDSGFVPASITPNSGEQPYPNAQPIVVTQTPTTTQTFVGNPGLEWDLLNTTIDVGPTDTYACIQIESPADQDGISGVWALAAMAIPIEPPLLKIEKGPIHQTIVGGSPVTFTIRIKNSGPTNLTDINVVDELTPECDSSYPELQPNAVIAYKCTTTAVTAPFTNTVIVSAVPPTSAPITATDSAAVTLLQPKLEIEKSPDIQTAIAGNSVNFTIQVTNSGDVALTGVFVEDPLVPECSQLLGTLAPGAVRTIHCNRDNVFTSFINSAVVIGIPPVGSPLQVQDSATVMVVNPSIRVEKLPADQLIIRGEPAAFTIKVQNSGDITLTNVSTIDPLAPSCSREIGELAPAGELTYPCTLDNVLIDFTNVITATGTTPLGNAVHDQASAVVNVLGPQIEIDKSPREQTIRVGTAAHFTITVHNRGDVTLNNVVITDTLAAGNIVENGIAPDGIIADDLIAGDLVPACSKTFAQIRANESKTYTCTIPTVQDDFVNHVLVSAISPSGERVTSEDSASVYPVTAILDVQKTPDFQTVVMGESATFTISVQNVGDAAFENVYVSNIIITDTQTPQCNATIGHLASGEKFTYTCTQPNIIQDFTNVAEAGGQPSIGDPISDQDWANVRVVNPAVSITKSPDLQTISSNVAALFTINVKNTGTTTLTQIAVTDPQVPSCSAAIGILSPGSSHQYNCQLDSATVDFVNEATVSGESIFGHRVAATDSAAVDVINPEITIEKHPPLQSVTAGGTAIFTITVENTGDTVLFDTTVIDALSPDCNRSIGDIGPGSIQSYTCIQPGVRSDFVNLAQVTGRPITGIVVEDSALATVDLLSPRLTLTKQAHNIQLTLGQTATFTITVQNSGDTVLADVRITDQQAPNCNREVGILNPGSAQSYICHMPNIAGSTTNIAVAKALPPVGPLLSVVAEAVVEVLPADLRVSKDDRGTITQPGGVVPYYIRYSNAGRGAAIDVVITEIVPRFSRFVPEQSSPEWQCENDDYTAGSVCQYPVSGAVAAGTIGNEEIIFAVQIVDALPETINTITNSVTIDGRNNIVTGSSNIDDEVTPIVGTALDAIAEPDMPLTRPGKDLDTVQDTTTAVQDRIFVPIFNGAMQ